MNARRSNWTTAPSPSTTPDSAGRPATVTRDKLDTAPEGRTVPTSAPSDQQGTPVAWSSYFASGARNLLVGFLGSTDPRHTYSYGVSESDSEVTITLYETSPPASAGIPERCVVEVQLHTPVGTRKVIDAVPA